jgi:sulfate transport system permease protein
MAQALASPRALQLALRSRAIREPRPVRWALGLAALAYLTLMLLLPLVAVFAKAFERGSGVFLAAVTSPDALAAIRLTLLTAALVVPLNALFGIAAAWAIAKFRFAGQSVLVTLIDLPFAVSPVIAGMVFVLLFGASGLLAPLLAASGAKVIFAVPGIVLATLFVTFPLVARELVPVLEAQGTEAEEAALALGASGFATFWRITLPNAKWALLHGAVLANARAMGEFGAVSVVSGHIRGETNTLPLHVEILYNEYQFSAAFAVASLLTLLAVLTLVLKQLIERRSRQEALAAGARGAGPGRSVAPALPLHRSGDPT